MRNLPALLEIPPGVTAVMGGGGKTSLIEYLADRLPGTALLCTTTRMYRPVRFPLLLDPSEAETRAALDRFRAVCVGGTAAENPRKLAAPALPFLVLASLADYVLTEADGSRGLPLKAHAPWEPVIPENAVRVVCVAGLDGGGRPVREVCHRPERFAALAAGEPNAAGTTDGPVTPCQAVTPHTPPTTDSPIPPCQAVTSHTPPTTDSPIPPCQAVTLDTAVTPELLARVLAAEGYGDILYLNKAEGGDAARFAEELADRLEERWPVPVVCGSLRDGTFRRLR